MSPGEEHNTMSSETLDPLLSACAELPARGNGRRPPHAPPSAEHAADLRRQILYLQSQVEERDRLVRMLQQQMSKMSDAPALSHPALVEDTCNVATQTDRLRPPNSTNLSNNENSGLVSWSEQNGRKPSTYSEAQKSRKPLPSAPVKCACGRKLNGYANGEESYERREPLQLKTNSRVGSRYVQAINGKESHRRDLSVNERLMRKNTLYASKSIENFHNNNLTIKKAEINFESPMKHCTSYGDIYGNSIGPNPIQTCQSTDTDYSSDGGYKSLPSSVNSNGYSKRVSGIPRRSVEKRLFASKPTVKASAI